MNSFNHVMTKLFPSCQDAARRISEQHDVPLSGPARFGLWLHLAVCRHCRRYSRQISFLRSLLAKYPDHLSRLKLPEYTRAEIVRKLSDRP